jgi:hypothetical protein
VVESSALLKRRTPKGYRGFESLPHRSTRNEALTVELAIVTTRSYNNFVGVTDVGKALMREIAARIIGASTYKKHTKIEA